MTDGLRIRDLSGWSIFAFGVAALLLGAAGIFSPEILLQILGFEVIDRAARASGDFTTVFLTASSMASFNMGVYYILAALNNVRQFYGWTVPFRILTFTVFTFTVVSGAAPAGFIGVAAWELVGAVLTGAALWYDRRKATA